MKRTFTFHNSTTTPVPLEKIVFRTTKDTLKEAEDLCRQRGFDPDNYRLHISIPEDK